VALSLKTFVLSLGCVVAWTVLLPAFVVAVATALSAYAVIAEVGVFLMGSTTHIG
jgi:hypothetical protein